MPHPGDDISLAEPTTDRMIVVVGCLSNVDVLANILAFLGVKDIMCKRRVCKKWKEAVRKTIVPPSDFRVESVDNYNAMAVMTREMPNLQQITLVDFFGLRPKKYNDGEDPDEERAAYTANWPTYDIEIISNFSKLRELRIFDAPFNGRYPVLFNSFPLLQKLSVKNCHYLKWDLGMLAGMPVLKELECYNMHDNQCVTGSISSLGMLEDTLEKIWFSNCSLLEGNFMDLADFPHLEELKLSCTAITGDIRDIGDNHFPSLERLFLPKGVYGDGYEFQRISDGPDLIRAVYLLKKQRPALKMKIEDWYGKLSEDSPDWYESADEDILTPPFYVCFVEAGSRIGYRWETGDGTPCEVIWLDPEPKSDSKEYNDYLAEYSRIQGGIGIYRGYYEPPTEEEYNFLEYLAGIDGEDY